MARYVAFLLQDARYYFWDHSSVPVQKVQTMRASRLPHGSSMLHTKADGPSARWQEAILAAKEEHERRTNQDEIVCQDLAFGCALCLSVRRRCLCFPSLSARRPFSSQLLMCARAIAVELYTSHQERECWQLEERFTSTGRIALG